MNHGRVMDTLDAPPEITGGWTRARSWLWSRREAWPSFVISLVVHLVGIAIAAVVVVVQAAGDGHDAGLSGPVEMAVISESELAQLGGGEALSNATPGVPEAVIHDEDLVGVADAAPGDETAREATSISDLGSLAGGGEMQAGGGLGLGGSGGGGTSFFGVAASGVRFAFLVDMSGSMEGPRLVSLQEELNKAIGKMEGGAEFLVVGFSSSFAPMGDRMEWREASVSGKRWARAQIGLFRAAGGTEPLQGFKAIFDIKPRPDAIYFMTDGEFNPSVVDDVAALNAKVRIPIHCITLESKEGEDLLKKIAEESKGSYKHVQVR